MPVDVFRGGQVVISRPIPFPEVKFSEENLGGPSRYSLFEPQRQVQTDRYIGVFH